jgi:predicted lactoylglutathione lyase
MEAHVISDDIYLLLVAAPYFKTITKKELPDATTSEAILQLQVDSRQCVDE